MIKLDYEAVRNEKNDGYKVRCKGSCIGNRAELFVELEAALESFDEQMPDLLQAALDLFLSKRGV